MSFLFISMVEWLRNSKPNGIVVLAKTTGE